MPVLTVGRRLVWALWACLLWYALAAGAEPYLNPQRLGQTGDLLRHLTHIAPVATVAGEPVREPQLLGRFYADRSYRPAWMDADGVYLEAGELVAILARAEDEGLRPADYHVVALRQRLQQSAHDAMALAQLDLLLSDAYLHYARDLLLGQVSPDDLDGTWLWMERRNASIPRIAGEPSLPPSALRDLAPTHPAYTRLREALRRYRAIAASGDWPELPAGVVLHSGVHDPQVPVLRRRLYLEGLLSESPAPDEARYDAGIAAAVRRFQRLHGLHPDGRVGPATRSALNVSAAQRAATVALNMERWRWLPREWPQRYVMVNMTDYHLTLVDGASSPLTMRVIIGREARPTPVFRSRIEAVVVNPYWYVPTTILREDLLPELRRDPGRLQRLNMQVMQESAGRWQVVDPEAVDWTSTGRFPYTLRQGPGAQNALGRFKFVMPGTRSIYLHDTPARGLFRRSERAMSSGCVRLEKPEALALRLLGPEWNRARLDTLVGDAQSRVLRLPEPWPVFLLYWTAWVDDDGGVNFRDDIYGRDKALRSARQDGKPPLSAAGRPEQAFNPG